MRITTNCTESMISIARRITRDRVEGRRHKKRWVSAGTASNIADAEFATPPITAHPDLNYTIGHGLRIPSS